MFYAVLALAVLRQQVTSKHSAVMAFFDREFARTGFFPKELSHLFHRAFESWQINDYGEFSTVSEEGAKQAIEDARTFVTAVGNYIKSIFPPTSSTL
jgi:uncharacterized protein (UPF0332 family)